MVLVGLVLLAGGGAAIACEVRAAGCVKSAGVGAGDGAGPLGSAGLRLQPECRVAAQCTGCGQAEKFETC